MSWMSLENAGQVIRGAAVVVRGFNILIESFGTAKDVYNAVTQPDHPDVVATRVLVLRIATNVFDACALKKQVDAMMIERSLSEWGKSRGVREDKRELALQEARCLYAAALVVDTLGRCLHEGRSVVQGGLLEELAARTGAIAIPNPDDKEHVHLVFVELIRTKCLLDTFSQRHPRVSIRLYTDQQLNYENIPAELRNHPDLVQPRYICPLSLYPMRFPVRIRGREIIVERKVIVQRMRSNEENLPEVLANIEEIDLIEQVQLQAEIAAIVTRLQNQARGNNG